MSNKKRTSLIVLTLLAVIGVDLYTQCTIFVVQPIGAIPEGRTLVISRLKGTEFVDSADAMCVRMQGGVNLLCRGMTVAAVAKNATIYTRLPYSDTLYLISTGGERYESPRREAHD